MCCSVLPFLTLLFSTILYCTVLHSIALCWPALYFTLLYFTLPYNNYSLHTDTLLCWAVAQRSTVITAMCWSNTIPTVTQKVGSWTVHTLRFLCVLYVVCFILVCCVCVCVCCMLRLSWVSSTVMLYCSVLCYFMPILCHVVLCLWSPHWHISYCTVLYCAVLCCAILSFAVPFCAIIYCSALYQLTGCTDRSPSLQCLTLPPLPPS